MIDRGGWESVAWIRARTSLLAVLLSLGFAAVLGRAIHLQVVEKDRLEKLARDQYLRTIELAPRRGEIHDRSGGTLASSVEVDSIFVDPSRLAADPEGRRREVARVARAAGLSQARTRKVVDRALRPGNRFTWVRRRASPAIAAAVRELQLPGVGFVKEPRRFYPQRELAAHVLGLVGADGEGLEGLERALEDELRGQAATVSGIRDARGRALYADGVGPASERTGATVTLTLDTSIQYLAEKALAKAVRETRATSGSAVVLDPHTGEVLALAVAPGFNPNVVPGLADRGNVRDRVVTDAFEPGSVIKVMLLAGALERGAIRRDTRLDCENGAWRIGRHVVHDHHRHGLLTPPDVLRVSSNVCTGKVAQKLGREGLEAVYRAFGFGTRTGIDLPGETAGLLAPMRSDIELVTASFGQGPITASPIQLAAALGAIASGGRLMRPYVVRSVQEPDGAIVRRGEPTVVRQVVSERTAREVLSWMEHVVSERGTAARAAIDGYPVAGKTGTAQKPDPVAGGYGKGRIASFGGIVPADEPRLVVLVVIDEPQTDVYGGLVAAPVFREIAGGALKTLGVPPSRPLARREPGPEVPPEVAAERAAEGAAPALEVGEGRIRVPDLRGLFARAAVRALAAAELQAALEGSGRVVTQRPLPGSAVEAGDRVTLVLEPL